MRSLKSFVCRFFEFDFAHALVDFGAAGELVVGRVPFALSQRFRGMLQRGVALRALDVTYVSSLSWYFF